MNPENKKTSNPEAFAYGYGTDNYSDIQRGMTLRDYFAAKAMQGLLSSYVGAGDVYTTISSNPDKIVREVYKLADAMLKQREL